MASPVFIIGAARSGTKLLRDSLAVADSVAAIPYDVTFVWRSGNESWPDDAIPASRCSASSKKYIRDYINRFAGRETSVLIEKTVGNSLRVPFVHAVFPEARFIHLLRDGRDVVESAYRQWQKPTDWRYLLTKSRQFPLVQYRYAIWYLINWAKSLGTSREKVWGPRYPGIDEDIAVSELIEVCARQWSVCIQLATRDLSKLPPASVFTVKYERLVTDIEVWSEICQFVGIDDFDPVINHVRASVRQDEMGKWKKGLDSSLVERMMPLISGQLTAHGYRDQ